MQMIEIWLEKVPRPLVFYVNGGGGGRRENLLLALILLDFRQCLCHSVPSALMGKKKNFGA